MKQFIIQHKLYFIGAVIGIIGGYCYWYFWGCVNGCTIQSSPWLMSGYGALMGALLLSMFTPKQKPD